VVTIIRVNWAIYGALIAGFLAVAGAAGSLVVQALRAWRAFKRLRRRLRKELGHVTELSDQAAAGAARAADMTRLAHSLERLRAGLAQLAVLRSALDEAGGTFDRLTALYPRK